MSPPFPPPRIIAQSRAAAEKLARQRVTLSPRGWQAWFDGSATPNPGRIGIGALLVGPDGERVEISRRAGEGTSGDAEYLALIAVLEVAVARNAGELLVHGDSQVIVQDVLMREVPAASGHAEHRTRVHLLMDEIGMVAVRWLPRHRNAAADALSQRALAHVGPSVPATAE
ncbi:ribonuclease HI [Pseudoduganella lurida]|uniref:Ribonuclease HI n=1 Tax=Pseudoduganella lurida TaxID=1036180 RepID=A0A562RKK9_9BURK|nr:ribonuclease HI family protein [Pseudoduganella lurida]TWI69578.1 ribonuclease HI [Pseudoduganella lurida]